MRIGDTHETFRNSKPPLPVIAGAWPQGYTALQVARAVLGALSTRPAAMRQPAAFPSAPYAPAAPTPPQSASHKSNFLTVAQGAHEHEAKEHDLPLVRQGRA